VKTEWNDPDGAHAVAQAILELSGEDAPANVETDRTVVGLGVDIMHRDSSVLFEKQIGLSVISVLTGHSIQWVRQQRIVILSIMQ